MWIPWCVADAGVLLCYSLEPSHAALVMTELLKITSSGGADNKPVSLVMTQLDKLRLQHQMRKV